MTIVGVVADTRRTGYDAVGAAGDLPAARAVARLAGCMLVVRTTGDPQAFVPALRSIVRSIDPGIAMQAPQPIDALLVDMTAQRRLNTLLLSVFGAVAALLAAVGIYGVIAYSVQQRTRELGVRVALGAPAGRILRLVLTEVSSLAVAGLCSASARALLLSRSMTTMLYGVSATDPATFAAIAVVAILTAVLASLIPALRAVRIDPVQALRSE